MKRKSSCPECGDTVPAEPIDRRVFIKMAGAASLVGALPVLAQDPKPNRTAEELIKELYAGLTDEQKKSVVAPFGDPARLKIYNKALGATIGQAYSKPQQELVGRILRAISSDEEGYRQITRDGTYDASKSFENCGANIFGDPTGGKFTWVFSGHHLTIRCDGDSEEGAAFGGPLYYGHTPNGYSPKNLFFYQTSGALNLFDSFSEAQRKQAVVTGTPGEGLPSVRFRAAGEARPGISSAELTKDQRTLIEKVMRDVLSPYRKEDADEVMKVVKTNGGMDKIHLAFYRDADQNVNEPWTFWRLEGPGFVWNYRVLPHVHTFVSVSSRA